MAKKPTAARGKTTRKGKIKKMFDRLRQTAKGKKTLGMSPGAMGGRTKTSTLMPGLKRRPLTRTPMRKQQQLQGMGPISENQRRQKLRGMGPMVGAARSTIKGAGMSGAAMSGQAMKLAKKLKTSGRLTVADIKRAKEMMKNRKGK